MSHGFTALRSMLLGMFTGMVMCIPCAFADTDQTDLSVGMKTLPLLTEKITGTATLAILFDPSIPASIQEANDIKAILDGGFAAPGDLKLEGRLVPVNDVGRMSGSRIAILTHGLDRYYASIARHASADRILTMSTDLGCVKANQCILGIVSKPNVEIYYSKIAAETANISFGQVFAMLVKQI